MGFVDHTDPAGVALVQSRLATAVDELSIPLDARELFLDEANVLAASNARFRKTWGHDAYCAVERSLMEAVDVHLDWQGLASDGADLPPLSGEQLSGRTYGISLTVLLHLQLPADRCAGGMPDRWVVAASTMGGIDIPAEALGSGRSIEIGGMRPDKVHAAAAEAFLAAFNVITPVERGEVTAEMFAQIGLIPEDDFVRFMAPEKRPALA